ncbi:LysR family transcriptional regulator [Quadrisphaera setariae]|uniref:LysR family transcriptional regulator n=1 Tax=Quadrisphaera setariae TaxID=2593304 RepID=UPI00164FB941|nr:LysR family transcriptional regulator [Quadrisphaera setariae]
MTAPLLADERQAQVLLAVVDQGSITGAAALLGMAQPSLSQAVRAMERAAGCPLFERTPRGTVPTAAGRALVAPAQRLVRELDAARRAVADVVALRTGTLDVVAHASVAADPLAAAVGLFRAAHPGVLVRVQDARDDARLVSDLARGRTELAVVQLPLPGTLPAEQLGEQEVWAVLPPGSSCAGEPLGRTEVAALPLVALQNGGSARTALRAELAETGLPRASVVTPQPATVLPLVLAGAGAALVDRRHAQRVTALGGVARPLDPPLLLPFGVVRAPGASSPAAEALVDALRSVCGRRRP